MKKQYNAPVARAIKFDYERVVAESTCDVGVSFSQSELVEGDCMDLRKDIPFSRTTDPCKTYNN